MSLELAGRLTVVLVAVATIVGAAELVHQRAVLAQAPFFSWALMRTERPWTFAGPVSKVLDMLLRYPAVLGLLVLQALAAAAMLVGDGAMIAAAAATVLCVHALLTLRSRMGLDGSDQMRTIVLAGLVAFYLAPTGQGQRVALTFIAAEAILAYLASGIAKLVSPEWRRGSAVAEIVRTRSYGLPAFGELLARRRTLSLALCWATIAFECAGPLMLAGGRPGCVAFVACGTLFHLGIAVTMGLNLFFWSFCATYPALLYLFG